jgi:ABC-type transport system involved in multi-copper enzyme maturation permease subunit
MPYPPKVARGWLRRHFAWSNSLQSWGERCLAGLLVVAAASLAVLNARLTLAQASVLWGALLLAAAAVLRQGWVRLFGPMLFYDLVRVARQRRYFLLRGLYAVLLALLLCWVYLIWNVGEQGGSLRAGQMARFAESFFYSFMVVQLVVVGLLTPASTAGSIADEKERRTLEFLLATDLRNREIVLSKLASRLANLALLIVTGLPVLGFIQFLGGVDPNLVLAGFAATGLTVVGLAGLSILNSVLTKRARDAIALTYLMAAAYLIVSGMSWLLLAPNLGLADFPSTENWRSPVTLQDVVTTFNAGNLVALIVRLMIAIELGKAIATTLPGLLRDYTLFQGLLAVFCAGWAVLRLRAVAIRQSASVTRRRGRPRLLRRPGVGGRPMFWKEVFAERGLRLNVPARVVLAVLIVASFVPVGFIVWDFLSEPQRARMPGGSTYSSWQQLAESMNIWVRVLGTMVACLLLLAVAARASSSVSGERDRQTLDALLTTPLDSDSILSAKWLGNILSVRWGWLWLGLIYGLGLATGGLHPVALPLLLVAWIVYAGAVSCIGLWFSVRSRTTLRATVATLLMAALGGLGHWLIWMCWFPLLITLQQEPAALESLRKFQIGFSPPFALGLLAFPGDETRAFGRPGEDWEPLGYALLGVLCWAAITALLWAMTSRRFRIQAGRTPFARPTGEPSAASTQTPVAPTAVTAVSGPPVGQ